MNTYEEKNWKYDLPFNNDVYRSIKQFSFLHSREEREILDAQIDFYRHHFSMEQLLNAFKICENIPHFKEVVYKHRENVLYCPKCLQNHYYKRIQKEFKQNSEFLLDILFYACKKRQNKNPMMPLYKSILGDLFKDVKSKIHHYSKRKIVDVANVKILPEDYITRANEIITSLKTDYLAHGIFGDMGEQDVLVNKHLGYGPGEIKNINFYIGDYDLYTIATCDNTLKLEELRHDIYSCVFPGKAHLFNSVLPKSKKHFDCGATFFVNGWDTFTAWHYKQSGFTRNSKTVNSKICYYLLKGNYKRSLENLNMYLLSVYPANKAKQLMITLTQYVGLFESYVMGALATEFLIDKGFAGSPADLLCKYRKVNCGDFFSLYIKNKNKVKPLVNYHY